MKAVADLRSRWNPVTGRVDGIAPVERRLSALEGCFVDGASYARMVADGDPVVYSVSSLEAGEGLGALHFGIGCIAPGRVGDEYFLTKGHLHEWRDAAELYIGLRGRGLMLLQREDGSGCEAVALEADGAVYVPGRTAHRTVNVGDEPLVYIGVYPATAGHDYGALRETGFGLVALATPDGPAVIERQDALDRIARRSFA